MVGALFQKVILWMMLMSLLMSLLSSLVKSKETEDYLNYLPFNQSDSSSKSAVDSASLFHSRVSPLQRFQFLFRYELRADYSRLRRLEEAIQYLDEIMGRSSKEWESLNQSVDSDRRSGNTYPQCNITNIDGKKPPFFGTVFYGGGLMSQFQSLSKSVMYGLHETHYSAPVIPIGVLHGYSTTQACDFADRSLFCYFQYLSPCQQGFHTSDSSHSIFFEHSSANGTQSRSHLPTDDVEDFHTSENVTSVDFDQHQHRKLHLDEIPILQSARYRHKHFHKEMIPKRFRQEGELFWWGAMQYYILLLLHPKIFEQYILQDALQETPSFMEHYLPFRPGTTASTSRGTPHVSKSRSGGTSGNNLPTSSSGLRSNGRDSSHSDIVQRSFGGKTRTNAHLYHRHERGNSNPSFSFSPVSSLDTKNPLRNLLATDDSNKNAQNSNNRIPPKPRNRIYPGGVVPPKQIKTTSIRKAAPQLIPTKSQLNNINMNANQQQQQYLRGPNNIPQKPFPNSNPIPPVHPLHNMDTDDFTHPHPLRHPPMINTKQEGNNNLPDGNHKMIQHNKPPRLPSSQPISSASSLAYSAQWKASSTGKTHRALSSLSILSLPRIGVHIRTRITPTLDTPEKRPHVPSSLQMNFSHFSLNDVNQHLKKTFQLCPIAMEIRTSHQPYIQCFLPIAFYPYSIATNETNHSSHNTADNRSNADSLHIWRLSEWLQAALQEKIHFIQREQLHVYTAKLSMYDSTNKTTDFTYKNNQHTFVNKNEIQEALSILKTICSPSNDTADKDVTCTMPENHSVLMALNGTWLLPVDVFLATDDIQALQIARKRYHWVFFPPGISYVMNPEYTYKGTLFAPPPPPPPPSTSSSASNASSSLGKKPTTIRRGHRNRQYHLQYKHIGAMLQASTYVSYFASYQVQATLEIFRDVFYLSHACRVLVGSVSSHVMRASVGMGYVTGSVQDVHWLEPEDKKRFWKDVFARTTMPIPELMQFP